MTSLTLPKSDTQSLKSFNDFLNIISNTAACCHWKYRGVTNAEYELVPTIGRLRSYVKASPDERLRLERSYLSRSFAGSRPINPEFSLEFLSAIAAQHYGAPTRLLDWTESPLIAAYFACASKCDSSGLLFKATGDAAIYAIHCCPYEFENPMKFPFPSESPNGGTYGVRPPTSTPRVAAQQSFFTISDDPTMKLEAQFSSFITHVRKYVIPCDLIQEFQFSLFKFGIRRGALFPEADGVNSSLVYDDAMNDTAANLCNLPLD